MKKVVLVLKFSARKREESKTLGRHVDSLGMISFLVPSQIMRGTFQSELHEIKTEK